jgi:hypothetical protein
MNEDRERFAARWSRLKAEARAAAQAQEAPPQSPPAPPPQLPQPETLTPESDFTPFMDPRVDHVTRRAALKMLFADAHFNVPDPFEAYSADYTVAEAIPFDVLKTLDHARKLLFDEPAGQPAGETQTAAGGAATAPDAQPGAIDDGSGRQDA